jgi:hypothetical protein
MFFEGRGATEITILNPALTDATLKTMVANFTTLRAAPGTVIIACKDQLGEGATIKYMEMMEATIKACSNAPALKTKVGAEATATVNISSTKKPLFMLATNAKEFGTTNKAYTMGDDSGLRTGSSGRPFKTVIFRAYENGVPDTNSDNWIIFPAADVEGNVEQAYNNNADRGYQITFTAYDPNETNRKIIIGNPNFVIP